MFAHAGEASVDELTDRHGPWPRALVSNRHDARTRETEDAVRVRPRVIEAGASRLVAESTLIHEVLRQIDQVAPTPATVLLTGETGVGKDLLAQLIHDRSPRCGLPMMRLNCGAIPTTLMESELFGHERGAFTGALERQVGRFEAAHRSTLFLDEIGELSAEDQVKLLRVLQDHVVQRLGNARPITVDVRVVAATNRNLEKAVEDGEFREDLFYRLNLFPIVVPALRERREDIPGLVWEFVIEAARTYGKSIDAISADSMRQLQAHDWPGNIRELRNVIERAVIMATSPRLTIPVQRRSSASGPALQPVTLKGMEATHIRATLERTGWRVRGGGGAAELLGLKPTTLETRMAKLGITRPVGQQLR
jgi:transcriptional regulator with GAF, ATPase, and Fis domain